MSHFSDFRLPKPIEKALKDLKFVTPTEIQSEAIPLALQGKDVIACAQTGSGKTAAYAIPVINRLIDDEEACALVLAPTRELAKQISDVVRDLTAHTKNIKMSVLVGGADMHKQLRSLKRKPRVIVATPGRLTDHLRRKSFALTKTQVLVLDEGDRMLDMGFAPQLDEVLKYLPKKRQTMLFTATMPPKVRKLAETYLYQPEQITVGEESQPVENIKQKAIQTTKGEKDELLMDELNSRKGSVIIFAKTQIRTDKLAKNLGEYGFSVSRIHGGRTQGQRNSALKGFRDGKFRILVATDIAARGIDVPQIEHVINYDLPMMDEDYVHRVGRTARAGASGEAISLLLPEDYRQWLKLAKKYKIAGIEKLEKPARSSGKLTTRPARKKKKWGARSSSSEGRSSEGRSTEGRSWGKNKPTRSDDGRKRSWSDDGEARKKPSRFGGSKKKASSSGGGKRPFKKTGNKSNSKSFRSRSV